MDSIKSLSGSELFELYLEDKTNDHFKDPQNLKLLLNHALNNMEDMIDSNLEMEIVDFCVEGLREDTVFDEEKIQFHKDKYSIIEKQQKKQRHLRTIGKMAAAAAVFVVVIGGLFFSGANEGKAGMFDWVDRLFVKEDGEQLVMETPGMPLKDVELKEGHLPKQIPDNYIHTKTLTDSSSLTNKYNYYFLDTTDNELIIEITEYVDEHAPTNNELEINNYSYTQETTNKRIYYYSSNETINSISWIYNHKIYTIRGKFEFSKLEKILSYYKEEQGDL